MLGASLFDYPQQNVDVADAFNKGMTNVFSMLAYVVLMAYDFAGISSIVDVGGGQGKLLEKTLQFTPDIIGTVFDTASTNRKSKARPWQRCIEHALLIRYRRLLRFGSTMS